MKTEAVVPSDCQWVVDQCKLRLKEKDKYGAKAWIITARSLYPKDFRVQWEVFNIHLFCKQWAEAAKTLAEVCGNFATEPQLQIYLEVMVSSLCGLQCEEEGEREAEEQGEEEEKIFQKLPSDIQKDVLQKCANRFDDTLKKCRVYVELMKRFPETVAKVGIGALDLLSKKFYDSPPSPSLVQPAHELLVYDVIPLLVSSSDVLAEGIVTKAEQGKVLLKMGYFCQWLEIVANFYAAAISRPALHGETGPLLHDSKTVWEVLHEILQTVAAKCVWKEVTRSKIVGPKLSPKQRWAFLDKFSKGRELAIAPFYVAVLLFFQMVWEYYAAIKGLDDSAEAGRGWVMVGGEEERDQSQELSNEQPPIKKRRLAEPETVVNFNTGVSHIDQYACERFQIAANCWDFLTSDPTYREEFSRLYKVWGAMDWIWFKKFEVDLAISKCDYSHAMSLLNQWKDKVVDSEDGGEDRSKMVLLDILTQLVSVHLSQGDISAAGAQVRELMQRLPEEGSGSKEQPGGREAGDARGTQPEGSGHHVTLLPCQPSAIIDFIVRFAVRGLKEALARHPDSDAVIGQLIILLQYESQPEASGLLWQLFQTIQKKRNFVCPSLLQYVTNVSILEEISFLANSEAMDHVKVVPETESESLRRKTVTRGVNREKQDKLSDAIQEQVKRWSEPPRVAVRAFLSQEQLAL